MKKYNPLLLVVASVMFIAIVLFALNEPSDSEAGALESRVSGNISGARNIIFMVADGMGMPDVTAARIYKNGLDGSPLYFETLENIGYQRTYSANSVITDSAAASSAWACGEKFNNGEICYHSDNRPHNPSVLEIAKKQGKSTGLVDTYTITHATPAAFGAHIHNRRCENEIARQYIEVTGVDVIMGGGLSTFSSHTPDACGTSGDFITKAGQKGYSVVYNKKEMEAAAKDGGKLLGLFSARYMVPEALRGGTSEPQLTEMTTVALDILEEDEDGFFLLIEGSQVDGANHINDIEYQVSEVLAFDNAVKVVLDWINKNPERRANTLLIVLSDHDTGGFAINGPGDRTLKGGELVDAGRTTRGHTGVDTVIWSQGPGSNALGRALDNTDIYSVLVQSITN